jgi:hypothetical protein
MKQRQERIEQRDYRGQMSLKKGFHRLEPFLQATDDREQGKRSLHFHAVVPGASGAQLAVLWHTVFAAKAIVGQDDAPSTELLNERLELVAWDIHRIPIPIATTCPKRLRIQHNLIPMLQHPLSLDFLPNCFGLHPRRMGNSNSIG